MNQNTKPLLLASLELVENKVVTAYWPFETDQDGKTYIAPINTGKAGKNLEYRFYIPIQDTEADPSGIPNRSVYKPTLFVKDGVETEREI